MMAEVKTFREQATMLRYTYVAYLVCTSYKKNNDLTYNGS